MFRSGFTTERVKVDREITSSVQAILYYNMRFPRVESLKFRLKNWMLPMFKKPQHLKGLTVNLQIFLLFCGRNPYG